MSAEADAARQAPPPPDFAEVFAGLGGVPPLIWNAGSITVAGTVRGGQHLTTGAGGGDTLAAPAAADAVERREGDIAVEQVMAAMTGFAEPGWFPGALRRLDHGIVFLTGRPGSGRRTAALNLLRRHTKTFALRAVDSDTDLGTWTPEGTGARGYLVDGLVETRLLSLNEVGLSNLRKRLGTDACMVVVTEETPRVLAHLRQALHIEPVHAEPPEPAAVLEVRLTAALPDPERRRAALLRLPEGFLDEILGNRLGPEQVVEVVTAIASVADGEMNPEEIGGHLSTRAAERAPQLLHSAMTDADDLALLLATSVFEHFDRTLVEEEARRLLAVAAGRLDAIPPQSPQAEAEAGTRAHPGFAFLRSRGDRFRAIEARCGEREVRALSTHSYITEPVAFVRHLQGRAVLDHVWREYREAGELLVEWLQQTPSTHHLADRAGFILGQFAQWSSGQRVLAPIEELAASDRPGDWRMAARAFGAASTDPVLATAVKHRLRGWSRAASVSYRCTAALTCATEFGLARPETALRLLRTVVTARDDGAAAVDSAVRRALLSLFAEPAVRPVVVTALVHWAGEAGPARRTACVAVAALLKAGATDEQSQWWTAHLLAGAGPQEHGSAEQPGVTLIRHALTEQNTYDTARDALLEWQRRAAGESRRAQAFERLVEWLAQHLHGGVFRLFTDLERPAHAPGAERASRALAEWRQGTPRKGRA